MLSTGSIISAGLWEINQMIANGARIDELTALKPALYAEYDAATNGKERHIAREKIKRIDKEIRKLSSTGGSFDRLINNLIR